MTDSFVYDKSGRSAAYFSTAQFTHLPLTTGLTMLRESVEFHERRNLRICLHHSPVDSLQSALLMEWTHSPTLPHWHPDPKSETFLPVSGSLGVVIFTDSGQISRTFLLGPGDTLRIPDHSIHIALSLSDPTIYHELKVGPYRGPDDRRTPTFVTQALAETSEQSYLAALRGLFAPEPTAMP